MALYTLKFGSIPIELANSLMINYYSSSNKKVGSIKKLSYWLTVNGYLYKFDVGIIWVDKVFSSNFGLQECIFKFYVLFSRLFT